MEWIYIIIGLILILIGFIGCFAPVIPGPPIAYSALLIQLFRDQVDFSTFALVTIGVLVLIVTILDYWFPIYGTKIFGGTKGGSWGSTIGLIVGLFFGPIGIILGPFIGAYIGELMNKQPSEKAFKSAIGSFLGFLAGTLTKMATVVVILIYFIYKLF